MLQLKTKNNAVLYTKYDEFRVTLDSMDRLKSEPIDKVRGNEPLTDK